MQKDGKTGPDHSESKFHSPSHPSRLFLHEGLHHVDGQGEDDGGVLLGGNGVEGLQVAQL